MGVIVQSKYFPPKVELHREKSTVKVALAEAFETINSKTLPAAKVNLAKPLAVKLKLDFDSIARVIVDPLSLITTEVAESKLVPVKTN